MNFNLKANRGFTLIEILIVVAIIGVLASVVLVGLRGTIPKGRDARRVSDLRQVQNGLELYYNRNGKYPPSTDYVTLSADIKVAGVGVSNMPDDPVSSKHYHYCAKSDQTSYVVGADLDDTNNRPVGGSLSAADANLICAVGTNCGANYCVTL